MDSKRFSVFNKSRQAYLSDEIQIVDAVLEPLKVLKVLIEGLDTDISAGLWLTHFKGVPVARTLSPFDLIYLDKDYRVVHCAELTTDSDFAPFKGLPESALVLPPQTIASSDTRNGDQLIVRFTQQAAPEPARPTLPVPAPPITAAARSLRDLSPTSSRFSNVSFPAPPVHTPNHPLDTFIGSHQAAASRGTSPQQSNTSQAQSAAIPAASRTSPVPVAPPAQSLPVLRQVNADPEPAALTSHSAQPRVVKPAKRKAPIPIHPITEKPAVPRYSPIDADEGPSLPSMPPRPAPIAQPTPIAAQAASPLVTRPSVEPPNVLQPLAPDPSIFNPKPKRAPGAPPPFTDYKNVVLPHAEEDSSSRTIRFLRWLFPDLNIERPRLVVDRRKAMRLPMPDLIAYFFTGGAPNPHRLQNISVTGFYLQTEDRWIPGTIIRMTLQRPGSQGDDPGDTLTVHSRVVRWGADGGGFEFVFSGFLD